MATFAATAAAPATVATAAKASKRIIVHLFHNNRPARRGRIRKKEKWKDYNQLVLASLKLHPEVLEEPDDYEEVPGLFVMVRAIPHGSTPVAVRNQLFEEYRTMDADALRYLGDGHEPVTRTPGEYVMFVVTECRNAALVTCTLFVADACEGYAAREFDGHCVGDLVTKWKGYAHWHPALMCSKCAGVVDTSVEASGTECEETNNYDPGEINWDGGKPQEGGECCTAVKCANTKCGKWVKPERECPGCGLYARGEERWFHCARCCERECVCGQDKYRCDCFNKCQCGKCSCGKEFCDCVSLTRL